jgi:hypothetical protein
MIHPDASIDEAMAEISALERQLADVRSEAAAWAERAEQGRFVIETDIQTVAGLEAENARLRAALQGITDYARCALEGK